MKAIIYLPKVESGRTPPMGKFLRSVEYDKHIWEGRDFDLTDPRELERFNETVSTALAHLPHLIQRPTILVIADAEELESNSTEPPFPAEVTRVKRAYHKRGSVPA